MTAAQQGDSQQPTDKRAVLTAAAQFLADTAESVHPALPASALLEYTALYRAQLAALVAACRTRTTTSDQGPQARLSR